MTRARSVVLTAVAVALVVATPPVAEARTVKVPLPSAGDLTLAHVVFKRSAALAHRLPKLGLVGRGSRPALRRYRVAVVGGSFRLSGKRVVGSVLLMRKRPNRHVARTPRAAAARIASNAPIASATVERNVIADLRRDGARASGEEMNAPTACGETGLFSLLSGDTIPPGTASFGLYYNNWDRMIRFSDPAVERSDGAESLRLMELTYAIGCGETHLLDPEAERWYQDLIKSLGARPPGAACGIITTYVGPATDGEGHVLTEALVDVSIRCNAQINSVTFTITGHTPTRCSDSAGHDCMIDGGAAVFPYLVAPYETRSFDVTTDPPVFHSDLLELIIETEVGERRSIR